MDATSEHANMIKTFLFLLFIQRVHLIDYLPTYSTTAKAWCYPALHTELIFKVSQEITGLSISQKSSNNSQTFKIKDLRWILYFSQTILALKSAGHFYKNVHNLTKGTMTYTHRHALLHACTHTHIYSLHTCELHLPLSNTLHLHGVEITEIIVLVPQRVFTERESSQSSGCISPRKQAVRTTCKWDKHLKMVRR